MDSFLVSTSVAYSCAFVLLGWLWGVKQKLSFMLVN